jgi:hypothetical protein
VDEQERLIARAALCDVDDASAAWDEFSSTVDLKVASPVLSWAAGYIHRNLESLGRSEPYLAGIARHNWLRNNLVLANAHGVLSDLAAQWTIAPLKSFGLSSALTDRRLRPLADIDIYVDPEDVFEVASRLRDRGFVPLLDVSDREFRSRVVPQRGSWNFRNTDGLDIDIHWKIFDHLDVALDSKLVRDHSTESHGSYGPIRQLSPELMVAIMCVQQQVQNVDSLAGLFDINNLLKHTDPQMLVSIARTAGSEHAINQAARAIVGILDSTPSHVQPLLDVLAVTDADVKNLVRARRFFSEVPRDTWDRALVKNRILYWTWWKLGHFARVERILIALFGPFSRGEVRLSGDMGVDVHFRATDALGPGWHYCYPLDDFRWANQPDSRFVLTLGTGKTLSATVIASEAMWRKTPVESIDVFLDGVWVSGLQRSETELHFTVPARRRRTSYELSIRTSCHMIYPNSDIHTNWYGLAIPLERLSLSLT